MNPQEPWIEFLDDPDPPPDAAGPDVPGDPGKPSRSRSRSPWVIFAALGVAALVVLAGTRALHGGGQPAAADTGAPAPSFIISPPQPEASFVPVITVGPDPMLPVNHGAEYGSGGPLGTTLGEADEARGAAAYAAVSAAVADHLNMIDVQISSEYAADADGNPILSGRLIEARDLGGRHLVIDIVPTGSPADFGDPGTAVPGAAVVRARVQTGGFTLSLTATGPAAAVPSWAALVSLGSDPRLTVT